MLYLLQTGNTVRGLYSGLEAGGAQSQKTWTEAEFKKKNLCQTGQIQSWTRIGKEMETSCRTYKLLAPFKFWISEHEKQLLREMFFKQHTETPCRFTVHLQ